MHSLVVAAIGIVSLGADPEPVVSLDSLLAEMVDRDRLARLPDPPYVSRQASSYDRGSVAPDKPGWFANQDTAQFIRVEKGRGHEEKVMMEAEGPGAIVRFWMGAVDGPAVGPPGTLRIYLDGGERPAIEGVADAIVGGRALVGPPLAAIRSVGRNLYLPIPYAKHCEVTYEGGGNCWYVIQYRTYRSGIRVRSFSMDDLRGAGRVGQALLTPQNSIERAARILAPVVRRLEPGGSVETKLEGPAAVRMLRVRLDAEDLPQALRSTILSITFDGEETVWCPAGDFFGSGVGLHPYRDWFRDVDRSGLLTAWWVMPFEKACTIRLRNLGEQVVDATLGAIAWSDWTWDERSMHFCARWRQEHAISTPEQDGIDWNYIEVRGQGVYAGDTLAVHNGSGSWWGEGDEKIFVDGESFPSHFGTGSEDYYGYSYGWPHFFEAPFHAQPCAEGNNRVGHTTNTRTRALDAIPFSKSLKLDIEICHHCAATKVTYAAATYFYARPGAVSNRPPLPEEARRPLGDVENRIPGAIEGESMEIIEKTGGVTETQSDGRWSGGRQLWWRDGKPGDRLVLALPVARAGTYRISIHTTCAFDYGIFRFSLDGEPLGEAVDIYSEKNIVKLTELGVRTLAAGVHRFAAEIAGTNPAAKPRHMLGLDYVKIEEVKR